MKRILSIAAASLMLLAAAAHAQLTGVSVNIPGSAFGTWQLTMESATAASPYANGITATLTIAIDGSLCSNGFYVKAPFMKPGIADRLYWVEPNNNLEFSISTASIFAGVEIASAAEKSYGFFRRPTDNSGSLSQPLLISEGCDTNQKFFELAEANYPDLFPEGVFVLTHITATEFYRHYSSTGTFLISRDGVASASGGKFGSTPVVLGDVNSLVAANVSNLPIPLTAAPSSFDSYYTGTYRMSLQNASTFSPLANGTQLTFVITADKKLCTGETVLESPLLLEDSDTVLWQNSEGGYYYALPLLPNSTRDSSFSQGLLNMFSSGGRRYGTFTGSRTSLSAECGDAKGINPDLGEINLLFDLAEQRLPALFPGGPLTYNQKDNGAIYRYYQASGVTAAVSNRQVTVKGGSFGTAPVNAGTLDSVIATLASKTPVTLPAALSGTYALTFAAAGSFSPVPAGTQLDLAITSDGNLCMDGTLYTNPTIDPANVNRVSWSNAQTGYVLRVDIAANTGAALTVQMQTLKGEVIGSLAGSKTLLLAKCAGLVGGNIDIDAANQLFALAEQRQSTTFPPSALTYNQLSDGSLKRYYPATGVLVTVTGDNVQVSGGSYGTAPRSLGKVGTLVSTLQAMTLPATLPPSLNGTYTLSFAAAGSFSPVPAGTRLDVAIVGSGTLCVDGTLYTNPYSDPANPDRISWKNTQTGYVLQVDITAATGNTLTVQMQTLKGEVIGNLTGSKTQLLAKCAGLVAGNINIDAANQLFGLLEKYQSTSFPPSALTYNQLSEGSLKRYYPATGVMISVTGDSVQATGGVYGNTPSTLGKVDALVSTLQAIVVPPKLPSALTGTYALTFAAAGSFSPVVTGTKVDAAITEDGALCMDGTLYTNPYSDPANVNRVSWKNTQTGYVLQLDITAAAGNALTVQMQTLKGEVIGNLAGNKTQLFAKCAGLVGGNINIDAVNQLFALLEQRESATFPPSALTYNQLSDGSLRRYYPATGVMVTVTGDSVQASGGVYGSTPSTLGTVGELVKQLSPSVQSTAALAVSGEMAFKQGNLPTITRRISINETVKMPTSTTNADLTRLVEQQLGNELNGSSTYTFSIVSNTSARLEFTVRIVNSTTIAGSEIARTYDLRFVYSRN